MVSDGVFRKTEKGRQEIATRANKLGLRERAMLIMVDDKASYSELLARSAHSAAGAMIDALLQQGFIELARGSASTGSTEPTDAAVLPLTTQKDASSFACRALVGYMGPAADDLTMMIEKSKNPAELRAALHKSREVLQAMAGTRKAEEFWSGVMTRLPGE